MEANYVQCPECQGICIYIETPSTHRSNPEDGVQRRRVTYAALNNENSWSAEGTPEFVCSECNHRWLVDAPIWWEWTGE